MTLGHLGSALHKKYWCDDRNFQKKKVKSKNCASKARASVIGVFQASSPLATATAGAFSVKGSSERTLKTLSVAPVIPESAVLSYSTVLIVLV